MKAILGCIVAFSLVTGFAYADTKQEVQTRASACIATAKTDDEKSACISKMASDMENLTRASAAAAPSVSSSPGPSVTSGALTQEQRDAINVQYIECVRANPSAVDVCLERQNDALSGRDGRFSPNPQPTVNLINPTAANNSPIEVTNFWTTVETVTQYYAVCLLCFNTYKVPEIHWNFINHGGKSAKAIRFILQEVSPFGEVERTGKMDLTGTFSTNVKIESRNNIPANLQGQGTHWNIIVTEILWADGTRWNGN